MKFAATAAEAFAQAAELERDGWIYIHPFDDPVLMAGQGTMALEILDDVPQVTDIVLSIGGGGMMAGVGTVIKALKPSVRIWGVETQGADSMARSLAAGKIVTLEAMTSIARSLGAPAPSDRTFAMAQQFLESVTVVSDKDAHRCRALSAGSPEGAGRARRIVHVRRGHAPAGAVFGGQARGAAAIGRKRQLWKRCFLDELKKGQAALSTPHVLARESACRRGQS